MSDICASICRVNNFRRWRQNDPRKRENLSQSTV